MTLAWLPLISVVGFALRAAREIGSGTVSPVRAGVGCPSLFSTHLILPFRKFSRGKLCSYCIPTSGPHRLAVYLTPESCDDHPDDCATDCAQSYDGPVRFRDDRIWNAKQ